MRYTILFCWKNVINMNEGERSIYQIGLQCNRCILFVLLLLHFGYFLSLKTIKLQFKYTIWIKDFCYFAFELHEFVNVSYAGSCSWYYCCVCLLFSCLLPCYIAISSLKSTKNGKEMKWCIKEEQKISQESVFRWGFPLCLLRSLSFFFFSENIYDNLCLVYWMHYSYTL